MARRDKFEIPAGFSFRPFAAQWKIRIAETVEWYEEPDRHVSVPALSGPSVKLPKKVIPEPEQVTIRVYVPGDSGDSTGISTSGMLYGFSESQMVKVFRRDLPDDVIRSHETRKNTPDISGRDFTVLVFQNPQLSSPLLPSLMKPGDVERDGWAMREEFFELDESDWDDSLWRFLNSWGLWDYGRGFSSISDRLLAPSPGFVLAFPHLLLKRRNDYRVGLKQPHKWLSEHSLSFSKIDSPPYFLVKHHYCGDAIEATITIDHLEGRRWGFCKRHDCRKYFEHTSEQKRLYCSKACAHLANVRELRRAKRKGQAKQKGARHNAKG